MFKMSSATPKQKIFIVEDNRFLAMLVSEKLRSEGMEVITCFEGADCVKKAEEMKPSLVLLDLLLPGSIDGFGVLSRLRKSKITKDVPVVVLTNLEGGEDVEKAVKLKIGGYLVKAHTSTAEIASRVKDVLEHKDKLFQLADVSSSPSPTQDNVEEARSKLAVERSLVLKASIDKALVRPEELSIITLVDELVQYAFFSRASDIHVDPEDGKMHIRFRVDGVMREMFSFQKEIQSEVITRIKVLSGLRTDEHQAAQDGRFKVSIEDVGDVDVRVSIAPTYYGENCVMRLLADQSEGFTLETLGFSGSNLKVVHKAIRKPYGMVLATGPTGSGKTTTLYAILRKLNTPEVSVITIEDPIEYSIKGIDQIQVNPLTNLTFAAGLRFILRQDPDIIMVGEIRDDETANIAINAAMTGHLVLSTLHTNDAATTLPRLIDMKIEPFLVATTVNIAISQRLVRTICSFCRVPKKLTDIEFENLKEFMPDSILKGKKSFFYGKGCDHCGDSGYRGRVGIHEVMEITEEIRNLIMKQANANDIKVVAVKAGMKTLLEDGFSKAMEGITTIEEVLRVSRD